MARIDDLQRVLSVLVARPSGWRRVRDLALVLVLFYTGLRVSELHRLDVGRVDVPAAMLRHALRKGEARPTYCFTPARYEGHPHRLRNAYATALLGRGVFLGTIQRLTNHASIQTTSRYLHADGQMMRFSRSSSAIRTRRGARHDRV